MMVSPMQGALLDAVTAQRERPPHVLDPFVGSGTTMLESLHRGLRFTGADINPLAILLCRVEAAGTDPGAIRAHAERTAARAARNVAKVTTPCGAWATKWYRPDVARRMAALRHAITKVPDEDVRRTLWVALAELARVSGNHRPDAPKLQTRPVTELARPIDIFAAFITLAVGAAEVIDERRKAQRATPAPAPTLHLTDARRLPVPRVKAELLLTSPPYGDNHTTMPYGQVAFLPLKWIDTTDIGPGLDRTLIAASKSLDTASLGGSLLLDDDAVERTLGRSPRLRKLTAALDRAPRPARARTLSFFSDLDQALAAAGRALSADAHAVLTLGSKTTYGITVPTAAIIAQLLEAEGFTRLQRSSRRLHRNRRMPTRNERSELICRETVLVMRRGA
jgi:hypothetical protein